MPVVEAELNGIVPYLRSGLRPRLGLVHWQHRGDDRRSAEGNGYLFLAALVIAGRAGAMIAQLGKVVVAVVAVGPGDVHASTRFDVNFHGGGLSAWIDG